MKKISYERYAYESVDDRSLSHIGYISKIYEKKTNSGHKGLIRLSNPIRKMNFDNKLYDHSKGKILNRLIIRGR